MNTKHTLTFAHCPSLQLPPSKPFKAKDFRSFSRQTTKEYTTKTIFEDVTPTFKTFNKDINIKDMLSAVQEMKEKKMITPQERDVLKEKIIEKEE